MSFDYKNINYFELYCIFKILLRSFLDGYFRVILHMEMIGNCTLRRIVTLLFAYGGDLSSRYVDMYQIRYGKPNSRELSMYNIY